MKIEPLALPGIDPQRPIVIAALIAYYRTGDLKEFDTYNIHWVQKRFAK